MEFRIYDVPPGGALLWEEFWTGGNSVQVSDGLFNVMLGSVDNTLAGAIAGHNELYLGITVGTDSEMSPRVQLGSVPFSMQALTVSDGAIQTSMIANDAVSRIIRVEPSTWEPSTDSISWAELPDMATTFTVADGGSNVLVLFSGTFYNDTVGGGGGVAVEVDGQMYDSSSSFGHISDLYDVFTCVINFGIELEAGTHTIKILWRRQGVPAQGNFVAQRLYRQLTILELKR
jgi:hypothetical protein